MSSKITSAKDEARFRRRQTTAVKEALRQLTVHLSLLNHQVGVNLALKDVDIDCLDLIGRYGPLSPSALARQAGLHPATITGILDRLEKAGWVSRERDPADRRGVAVKALKTRSGEVFKLYSGMNSEMDDLCAGYDAEQLELIADFLRRTTEAGTRAASDLAAG